MIVRVRRATLGDACDLASLDWLQEQGSNQWSTRDQGPLLHEAVRMGDTWLMLETDTNRLVASLNLTTRGDPDFWTDDELITPALYLSKLATHPNVQGRGLGALFIEWANGYAATWGIRTLRWDVWRTNHALQSYYERLGIPLLRTVDVPGRWSGALYEVAYRPTIDLGEQVITEHQPLHRTPLPSRTRMPLDIGEPPDPLQAPRSPGHWHQLDNVRAPMLGSPQRLEPQSLTVGTDPILVFHSGLGWCARQQFPHPITSWEEQPPMQPGRLHTITHEANDTDSCQAVLVSEYAPVPERPSGSLSAYR